MNDDFQMMVMPLPNPLEMYLAIIWWAFIFSICAGIFIFVLMSLFWIFKGRNNFKYLDFFKSSFFKWYKFLLIPIWLLVLIMIGLEIFRNVN